MAQKLAGTTLGICLGEGSAQQDGHEESNSYGYQRDDKQFHSSKHCNTRAKNS